MDEQTRFAKLSPQVARQAIDSLMSGEPPPIDLVDLMSVSLERDLRTFSREYFNENSFIVSDETQGSTFKIVEAYYGGGKTHYLRAVQSLAHKQGFVSAFVGLRKTECPLTRFDKIYTSVTESLVPPSLPDERKQHGLSAVLQGWVSRITEGSEDPIQTTEEQVDRIGDLPLMSIKVAVRMAAVAIAANDPQGLEEILVYLTSGRISPSVRKHGVLEKIDATNGSVALRSLATLVKKLGHSGLVLILDEGDRSLSIASTKERKTASNNLVQLINETASAEAWPSTILLYSIPSWQSFHDAFADNQALIQRVEQTGFPSIPPAPRIVLDEREKSDEARVEFCCALGKRLEGLFRVVYGDDAPGSEVSEATAVNVAQHVIEFQVESTFRRLFVQSYLAALYRVMDNGQLSESDARALVEHRADDIAKSGN